MTGVVVGSVLFVLFVAPIFPLTATLVFIDQGGLVRQAPLSLRERTWLSIRDWLVASMVAVLAGNRIFNWNLPHGPLVAAFFVSMVLVSAPSAIWLYLFLTGKFKI
jgi:hypothetical protein